MTGNVAFCGLSCRSCPIYLATLEENKEEQERMRAEIARMCNERYGTNYQWDDITDCDGCRADTGRIFSGSRYCSIRKCAREKELENCAYCAEYPCGKLETLFGTETAARERLDAIRSRIL